MTAMILPAAALLLALGTDAPISLERSALARLAMSHESRILILKLDLHEPDLRGETMQLPTLEKKGWHHHNPEGLVVLRSGSRVEVTGVFNYSERGLLLELAREDPGVGAEPAATRPRCRIRILVEAPAGDPSGQTAEALDLIAKVLEAPVAP